MHITSSRNIWQKPSFTMVKQITYPTQKVEHLLISDRQGKCNHSSSVYLNQQKVSSSIVAKQINPFTPPYTNSIQREYNQAYKHTLLAWITTISKSYRLRIPHASLDCMPRRSKHV